MAAAISPNTGRAYGALQRWPGASPPVGTACPMESVDGLRPPSLPTGPTKAADNSRRLSFMRAIPSGSRGQCGVQRNRGQLRSSPTRQMLSSR